MTFLLIEEELLLNPQEFGGQWHSFVCSFTASSKKEAYEMAKKKVDYVLIREDGERLFCRNPIWGRFSGKMFTFTIVEVNK
jgi:hypothetical protein